MSTTKSTTTVPDPVRLPEEIEQALNYYLEDLHDDHAGYDCGGCQPFTNLRRVIQAALLETAGDEHEKCCDYCISSDQQKDDCQRRQNLRVEARRVREQK